MVRILTDSACDMPPAQAKEWGIDIIPNIVTFPDGTVIRDSVDMTLSLIHISGSGFCSRKGRRP